MEQKKASGELASFSRFPDLILMDGGRGQVNIALKVLENLGLSIPVCGMVKDDYHRTRGLYYENRELEIDTHSEGFKLITRIQDEAHRFAIEYHKSLRGKQQIHSILDDIPGIGPSRRKALMRAFKSLEAIRDATEEELAAVPSMNAPAPGRFMSFSTRKELPGKTEPWGKPLMWWTNSVSFFIIIKKTAVGNVQIQPTGKAEMEVSRNGKQCFN